MYQDRFSLEAQLGARLNMLHLHLHRVQVYDFSLPWETLALWLPGFWCTEARGYGARGRQGAWRLTLDAWLLPPDRPIGALIMPYCERCGKPITGAVTTAFGKTWHPACFACAGCGKTFGRSHFYPHEGQPYCHACYVKLIGPTCAVNGHPIEDGRYRVKDGLRYCEAHYWERFGVRCAIGGEILKHGRVVNIWGETYCRAHSEDLPICDSCSRPICAALTGGGVPYPDGRQVCSRCRRTAVDDVETGGRLLAEVSVVMAGAGLDTGQAPIPLALAGRDELAGRGGKPYAPNPAGIMSANTVTRDGAIVERRAEITVLYGLTREQFQGIIAHELMHVHLFLHAFPDLPDVMDEGLCELVEYLWLEGRKTSEAAVRMKQMVQNRDPIYGEGLRQARAAYNKMSRPRLPALLAFARLQKHWP